MRSRVFELPFLGKAFQNKGIEKFYTTRHFLIDA